MTIETDVESVPGVIIYIDPPARSVKAFWGGVDWVRDEAFAHVYGSAKVARVEINSMIAVASMMSPQDPGRTKFAYHQYAQIREVAHS
jgi:hypothetical protein